MDVFHGSDLATLIPNTQVVVGVTRIPRAALKDIGLAGYTLLMPVYDYSVQGRLTSGASLLVCIGWVKSVVHLNTCSVMTINFMYCTSLHEVSLI